MEKVGSRDGEVSTLPRGLNRTTAGLDDVVGKLNTRQMEFITEEADILQLNKEKKDLPKRNNLVEAENGKIRTETNAIIKVNQSFMENLNRKKIGK